MKKTFNILAIIALFCSFFSAPVAYAVNDAATITYSDVTVDDWFYEDVLKIVKEGWMKGKTNRHFAPNDTLSNAELAQILYNGGLEKINGSSFTDVSQNAWYYQAVMQCGEYFPTHEGQKFLPETPITRKAFCYTLLRAIDFSDEEIQQSYEELFGPMEKDDYTTAALRLMFVLGIIKGDQDGNLLGENYLTRAECAVIINRLLTFTEESLFYI